MTTEERENEIERTDPLLEHRYDDIQEYDNPMPSWWVWGFWATFWFSCAYLFHYWAGNGVSVEDDYAAEMAVVKAEAAKRAMGQSVSEESLAQVVADAGSVKKGAEVFGARCLPCHGDQGQGLIGPNLTDSSWIHGGGALLDIYGVVSDGVLEKGMPAWNRQLTPSELRQVVAFVGTLRGTNVAGKSAEGTVVAP